MGLLENDSGKTSVATSLVREARSRGIKALGVKPVGGHSAWGQYDTLVRSLKYRMLVGEDAYRLWLASGRAEPLEAISPLDVLTAPPDPENVRSFEEYLGLSENIANVAVMLRVTRLKGDRFVTRHYLAEENLEKAVSPLKDDIRELAGLVKAERITGEELLELAARASEHVDSILRRLLPKYELFVVESFNNAALPTPLCLEADWVVLVAPGRAYVYQGDKYSKAVESLVSIRGPNITTLEVSRYLKPLGTVALLPRSKSDLDSAGSDTRELMNFLRT